VPDIKALEVFILNLTTTPGVAISAPALPQAGALQDGLPLPEGGLVVVGRPEDERGGLNG
jgi:hypothetical protein